MELVLTRRSEGVQNPENLAHVIYERPLSNFVAAVAGHADTQEEARGSEVGLVHAISLQNFLSAPWLDEILSCYLARVFARLFHQTTSPYQRPSVIQRII